MRYHWITRLVICTALAVSLFSCGEDGATLAINLRTDYVPQIEFSRVRIFLTTDAGELVLTHDATNADYVEGQRVATFEGLTPGSYQVRSEVLATDGRIIGQRLLVGTIQGVTSATLVVSRSCAGVRCPSGSDSGATECSGGRCVEPACSPENPSACEGGCTMTEECVADVSCATGVCTTEGSCLFTPTDGACEPDEYCELALGCQARPALMDAGAAGEDGGVDASFDAGNDAGQPSCDMPCDTGNPCEAGVFDCASGVPVCVGAGAANSGTVCGEPAGPCDAEEVCDGVSTECPADAKVSAGMVCNEAVDECDIAETCDGESNACPIDVFQPIGNACSVGFCDASHACSDSCTPGVACTPSNICREGLIECSGDVPTCVESGNVSNGTECMSTEFGAWGSCGGYASSCDETGTQSQDVTSHSCQSGTCAPSMSTGSRSCSRSTEGGSCGSLMTGSWGSCGGYSGSCDETGTRTRMITTPLCESGGCTNMTTTETGACSRDTEDDSCGSITNGSWGSCGGYSNTCDETGMRSRSVMTPTCGNGTCSTATTSQSESCSRDTDGGSCGSISYGSWGACGSYSSTCDETGTRSRSVMTPSCGSGSCNTSTTSQNEACSRNTDGSSCGTVTYGSWSSCGGFTSTCDTTGTRSRSVMTPSCSAGGCSTNTTSQTESCTRSTTGVSCGTTELGSWGPCTYTSCASTGTRSRPRTIYTCSAGSCNGDVDSVSEPCSRTVTNATTCSGGHCCGGSCTDTHSDAHCGACGVNCGGLSCGANLAGWQCLGCSNNSQCITIMNFNSGAQCEGGGANGCTCNCNNGSSCADGGCGAGNYCHDAGPYTYCSPSP